MSWASAAQRGPFPPTAPVVPVAERLGDGAGARALVSLEVRDGAADAQHTAGRAGREAEAFDGAPEQGPGFGGGVYELVQDCVGDLGVAAPGGAAALLLVAAGLEYAGAHLAAAGA